MPGESITTELIYPILCLSQRAGFTVVRSAEAFGRSAALFWDGYYTGLRVVDSSGAAYDVVNAEIAHPQSTFGRVLARLFDGNMRVAMELRPAGPAALEEVREHIGADVSENPEEVEEMTGRSAHWWKEMLVTCVDAADVVRRVDAATPTA